MNSRYIHISNVKHEYFANTDSLDFHLTSFAIIRFSDIFLLITSMHAGRNRQRGKQRRRSRAWGIGDNEGIKVHWSETKAGHQYREKSVISWSKPEM